MFRFLKKILGTSQSRTLSKYRRIVDEINSLENSLQSLSDEEIKAKTQIFIKRYQNGESLESLLPEAYAVVKNACRRLCGTEIHVSGYDQKWDMVPHDVQLLGAIAMFYGCVAEMQTGEGKTLTAVLPLYLHAITGKSAHLVTVNDYLATRDCEWVGTVIRWLGLTTGALTNAIPTEERKEIYLRDVVYGTASEFGFDYLRDNSMAMTAEQQVQKKGHFYAIIDELDSILIDEARTPLIISGPVPQSQQMYDELKTDVAVLVKMQRDLCNRLAIEAKKQLEKTGIQIRDNREEEFKLSKENHAILKEALRQFWIVSKGMPHNKTLKRILEDPDLRNELDSWDIYYFNDQNKQEKAKALAELFIIVDEKSSEYELTDRGIQAWSNLSEHTSTNDFLMFDLGYEYAQIDEDSSLSDEDKISQKVHIREEDAKRKERAHNLRQLLRAHLLMERDVDYIIQDNKIVIIDEHTGRPQPGRRFSDGLHQAIEAKEMVAIQQETQTYATITLQNYFRLYEKLAGMTGTAMTEAGELKEIYKLEVLEIPTYLPCVRKDGNDQIYMTEREKYNAILKDIQAIHGQERPILIGTESVEISEKLSRILKQHKLPHTVLNAKHHAQEAEIIAGAGKRGAITLATNMAGRGTDIKLDKGIAGMGGLHVIGTTRHQSRRIDRQLRGRCARQGDPGSSQFYVSFEDSLMRLFASPRLNAMLKKWRPPEGEPISAGILNKSIETAQKRIEQRNYMMRKYTLEYDDVINKQREVTYNFRNDVLHSANIQELAEDVIQSLITTYAEKFFVSREQELWDPQGFRNWLMEHFPVTFEEQAFDDDYLSLSDIEHKAYSTIVEALHKKIESEQAKTRILRLPQATEGLEQLPLEALRRMMIFKIDASWQEHLLHIDNLRSEVALRSVGQKDPLMEFKHESFALFEKQIVDLKQTIASNLFKVELILPNQASHFFEHEPLSNKLQLETDRSFIPQPLPQQSDEDEFSQDLQPKQQPITHLAPKVGRNDVCPCGSGKKHKKCCGIGSE